MEDSKVVVPGCHCYCSPESAEATPSFQRARDPIHGRLPEPFLQVFQRPGKTSRQTVDVCRSRAFGAPEHTSAYGFRVNVSRPYPQLRCRVTATATYPAKQTPVCHAPHRLRNRPHSVPPDYRIARALASQAAERLPVGRGRRTESSRASRSPLRLPGPCLSFPPSSKVVLVTLS